MHVFRTSTDLEALSRLSLDPELLSLIGPYAAALEEFGDDLAATMLIVDAGDTLEQAEQACGLRLVTDSQFTLPVELIEEHNGYISAAWIISDDGSGLVVIVELGGDAQLIAACRAALADSDTSP